MSMARLKVWLSPVLNEAGRQCRRCSTVFCGAGLPPLSAFASDPAIEPCSISGLHDGAALNNKR